MVNNIDPSVIYKTPAALLADTKLSKAQKIALLKNWARDAYELSEAANESMTAPPDNSNDQLSAVLDALLKLGVEYDPHKDATGL